MCDDELGHDFKDHITSQLFRRAALGDEAERVLEQLDKSLTRVDSPCVLAELFGDWVLCLDRDIEGLALTKVERQPVGESFVVN